jgi:hypothetical protein
LPVIDRLWSKNCASPNVTDERTPPGGVAAIAESVSASTLSTCCSTCAISAGSRSPGSSALVVDLRTVVNIVSGRRRHNDLASVGINPDVQFTSRPRVRWYHSPAPDSFNPVPSTNRCTGAALDGVGLPHNFFTGTSKSLQRLDRQRPH